MKKSTLLPHYDVLEFALNYPYDRPAHSYSLVDGEVTAFPTDFWPVGRTPVIACGSNAAPAQLIRKYGHLETDPVYVTAAKLENFICCYSAHITSYGAIPATLAYMENATTECHITWLTESQLEHMHKTEAIGSNYRYSELDNINLVCSERGQLNNAFSYISLHGNLQDNGHPIAIDGIKADPPPLLALDQVSIQRKILAKIAPNTLVNKFVSDNISDIKLRRARVELLKQNAKQFCYPHEKVILT